MTGGVTADFQYLPVLHCGCITLSKQPGKEIHMQQRFLNFQTEGTVARTKFISVARKKMYRSGAKIIFFPPVLHLRNGITNTLQQKLHIVYLINLQLNPMHNNKIYRINNKHKILHFTSKNKAKAQSEQK
jgi:hypothetical protein